MHKNLTVNPNKMSQPAGAALALMGVKGMIPLWHGVQGCTAFAKILFISHFREPMPFQNTAISQTNVIMGSEQNIIEAVDNIKDQAEIIGLLTTGVTETSGVDLEKTIKTLREKYPDVNLVSVNTPDFEGNLSTGYAKATASLLASFVEPKTQTNPNQIVVFPGPFFTPGEIETLKGIIVDFGLKPLFIPDLGDSLYGYLEKESFSPNSNGGITLSDLKLVAESGIALSIGSSMEQMAIEFAETHDMPYLHYANLGVLEEIDHFFHTLEWISSRPTPQKYRRQRQHYLDTLLDTDFHFHGKCVAIAGDREFVQRWKGPLNMLEMKTIGIVNQLYPGMEKGDCDHLAQQMINHSVDFVIGNSHVATIAEKLNIPVIRSGIPVTDRFGEPQSVRIGYQGAARMLMEYANAVMETPQHHRPYQSPLTATLL